MLQVICSKLFAPILKKGFHVKIRILEYLCSKPFGPNLFLRTYIYDSFLNRVFMLESESWIIFVPIHLLRMICTKLFAPNLFYVHTRSAIYFHQIETIKFHGMTAHWHNFFRWNIHMDVAYKVAQEFFNKTSPSLCNRPKFSCWETSFGTHLVLWKITDTKI